MSDFSFSLQRLLNTPLLCTEKHAAMVVAAVQDRLGLSSLRMPDQDGGHSSLTEADLDIMARSGREQGGASKQLRDSRSKIYEQAGFVAIVPVWGTLTKNTGSMDPSSGMTGYNRIEQKIVTAQDDPQIRGVWLDHDSGGGEAGGMLGLADMIYNLSARKGGKPIWSMAAAYSYSASYGIMAAADKVIMPPEGGVGSVGVIMLHADMTKFYKSKGIDITVMRSGKRKAKFNSVETPDGETLEHIQAQLDDLRGQFAAQVAKHRGISEKTVLETEGLDYMATRARAIGFVDAVMSEQQAFASFVQFLSR